MKTVRFQEHAMAFAEAEVPTPGPGEALVKILASGVCNTDLELFKGYMGFSGVAGHEFAGRVEKAPDAPDLVGARVCCDINWGSEAWSTRHGGDARHCPGRRVLGISDWDGAFAEYILAPTANLRRIPENVSNEQAVFAEPLAAALEASQQMHLRADMKMLVLGDGKLGLLCACGLRHFCPGLVLAGKHAHKLTIAEKHGVTVRRIDQPSDLEEKILPEFGLFDVVVEATGSPDGINHALNLTRPEGTVVAKTTSHAPSLINLAKIVVDEILILGSRCGDIGLALSFLKDGLVDVGGLIEARYPFAEFEQAFAHASRKGALKVLLAY